MASVPVTVKLLLVFAKVVAPLLQTYEDPPPLAESTCVDEPQIGAETEAGETVGAASVGDILIATSLLVDTQEVKVFVLLTV